MEYGGGGVEERWGHTRMGIASVVIAVLATVLIVVLIIVVGSVATSMFQGQDPATIDPQSVQDSPEAAGLAAAGFGILGGFLLYFVGLVLGVAGIFQRRKKRLFGILGAVFNGLVLLAILLLIVLSLFLGAAVPAAP